MRGDGEGPGVRHGHGVGRNQHDERRLQASHNAEQSLLKTLPLQVRFGAGEQQEGLIEAILDGVELELRVLRVLEVVLLVVHEGAAGAVVVQLVAVELDDFNVLQLAEEHLPELSGGGSGVLRAGEGDDEGQPVHPRIVEDFGVR